MGDLVPLVIIGLVLLIPSALLALPAFVHRRNLRPYARATVFCLFLVVLPLIVFFLDELLGAPSWKGACKCGWIDGFHVAKAALLPVVLFAIGSLYYLEVVCLLGEKPSQKCCVGLWCGTMLSALATLFAIACVDPWGFVLAYLPAWFGYRAWQLQPGFPSPQQLWATAIIAPFWTIAGFWARSVYEQLPATPPKDCFVVTAAARGHRNFVGPFALVEHNGSLREANAQLIALWRFESHWRRGFPQSHAAFRLIYNRVGPFVAARITSQWIADIVYVALKPLQWIACAIVSQSDPSRVPAAGTNTKL